MSDEEKKDFYKAIENFEKRLTRFEGVFFGLTEKKTTNDLVKRVENLESVVGHIALDNMKTMESIHEKR
tara:strand:+ start:264 stop:470 length:207 start_codon:yes stop_codon:yes gene_type:complete